MPTLEAWGTTDPGLVRQNNEDNWSIDPALKVAVVADGMGGASCGEVAAAITVETVLEYLRCAPVVDPGEAMEAAIKEANRRVLDKARADDSCNGMGSTVVVALWDLPRLHIANVGDSRAYLWRDGALTQLSYDQTLVNELRTRFGLSEAEVSNFPHKNVLTQAVGTTPELTVRMRVEELEPGDLVLLCSDGLSGPVSEPAIAATLSRDAPLQYQVEQLITQAKAAGGPDNVTAVLLRYNDWQIL
jgi:serine/threonine protein phosphatase PrpC